MSQPQARSGQLPAAVVWAIPAAAVALVLAAFAGVFLLAARWPGASDGSKPAGEPAQAVAEQPAGALPPGAALAVASADAVRIAADPWFAGRASAGSVEAMLDRAGRLTGVVVVYDQDSRFAAAPHEGYKSDILDLWGTVFNQSAAGGVLEDFGFPARAAATDFRVFLVPRSGASRREVVRLAETSLITMSYRGLLATDKRQMGELGRIVNDLKRDTEKGR